MSDSGRADAEYGRHPSCRNALAELGFDIPIIFISAFPDDAVNVAACALQRGAIAFLLKPFEVHGQRFIDHLLEALEANSKLDS